MNNLRKLLESPVGPRRIPVSVMVDGLVPVTKDDKPVYEADGKTPKMKKGKVPAEFAVFGMPDSYFLGLQMLEDPKKELRARHWTALLKQRHQGNEDPGKFTTDDVFRVLLVHHYLETPEGEEPMTEAEVAFLSKEHGIVFSSLFAAALQIVGNTEAEQTTSPEVAAGLGNS